MQKIFINKETDMVEQILEVLTEDELSDNYFESCYAIMDYEDKIKTYNLKYNKELEQFEIVEGVKEKEEVIIIESETEKLRREVEELKKLINSQNNI